MRLRNHVLWSISCQFSVDFRQICNINSLPDFNFSYHYFLLEKSFDLNITDCVVSDNNGRGVGVENMRSLVHLHNSSVSSNTHVAGLHVMSGVGDVNVTDSRIAFNIGDGVNITHSGGSRNVTRSLISSNSGFGVAVFVNDTEAYVPFLQETIVSHSVIYKNLEAGVLVGNFCTPALVNISANWFNDSSRSAVEIHTCWKQLNASNFVTLQVRSH
jgi:hypothetical protein